MDGKIDMEKWDRKDIFSFFGGISNPFYVVTYRQDVTELYSFVKRNKLSFYYSLIYLCTKAVNNVNAFHKVIRGGEVFRIGDRIPSFTDLKKGSESFYIVTLPLGENIAAFSENARKKSAEQTFFIDKAAETDALIYFSCLPWVDITAVTNERDLSAKNAPDDSVPHITWGKYVKNGDRLELGISVEVNHRLIDGVHIGRFAEELDRLIKNLGNADLSSM